MKEQVLRQKFEGMTKNLQEENKIVRDLEKSERHKLKVSREYTVQQQETISHLIEVKSMLKYTHSLNISNRMFEMKRIILPFLLSGENMKLSEQIKQLETSLAHMKRVRSTVVYFQVTYIRCYNLE